MHVQIDDDLLTEPTPGVRLEVQRVLVALHVALTRKHFAAHVAGKLAALPLMNFRDVNAEVFGISKIFTTDPAHKFGGGGGGRGGGGAAHLLGIS